MPQPLELNRICSGNRSLKPLLTALFLAIWPAGTHAQQAAADWDGLAAHPLNGTIWTADGEELSDEDLSYLVGQAKYILIGEIHDNARHHQNQAQKAAGSEQPDQGAFTAKSPVIHRRK